MRSYEYNALDTRGLLVQGRLSGPDELAIDRALEERGLIATRIRPARSGSAGQPSGRLSRHELMTFTTQVATLLGAGVPLLQGLKELGPRLRSEAGRRLLADMVRRLEGGETLSEAVRAEPRSFPDIYRASVEAGELSGELPAVLRRMAGFLEWTRAIRATTVQALVYPAILCVAITGLVLLLLTFLLPRILSLMPGGRENLPPETKLLLALSDFLSGNAAMLLAGLLAGIVLARLSLRRPAVRVALSGWLLGLPRLGEVARMLATARFASTAHTLHAAGCEVYRTLSIAARSTGNAYLESAFLRVAERVRGGATITAGLSAERRMDPMLVQVTAIGEQAGELDQALERLVAFYDQEVPRTVKWFLAFFEPALLVVAALVVAFILMATMLPIFSLYESL